MSGPAREPRARKLPSGALRAALRTAAARAALGAAVLARARTQRQGTARRSFAGEGLERERFGEYVAQSYQSGLGFARAKATLESLNRRAARRPARAPAQHDHAAATACRPARVHRRPARCAGACTGAVRRPPTRPGRGLQVAGALHEPRGDLGAFTPQQLSSSSSSGMGAAWVAPRPHQASQPARGPARAQGRGARVAAGAVRPGRLAGVGGPGAHPRAAQRDWLHLLARLRDAGLRADVLRGAPRGRLRAPVRPAAHRAMRRRRQPHRRVRSRRARSALRACPSLRACVGRVGSAGLQSVLYVSCL